ncbi:MAG: hypothetical protein QXN55_06245, partial [Candidatus Nitrosotenuis sp.]
MKILQLSLISLVILTILTSSSLNVYSFSTPSIDQVTTPVTSKTFELNLFENIAVSENSGNNNPNNVNVINQKEIFLHENLIIDTNDDKINFIVIPSLNSLFATIDRSLLPKQSISSTREQVYRYTGEEPSSNNKIFDDQFTIITTLSQINFAIVNDVNNTFDQLELTIQNNSTSILILFSLISFYIIIRNEILHVKKTIVIRIVSYGLIVILLSNISVNSMMISQQYAFAEVSNSTDFNSENSNNFSNVNSENTSIQNVTPADVSVTPEQPIQVLPLKDSTLPIDTNSTLPIDTNSTLPIDTNSTLPIDTN